MSKLNLAKNLAVSIKGFIAIIMQIIVMRELLVVFSGNELSLGIVLASWLLLEALGSGLIAKFFTKIKNEINAYIILQILIIFSLPLTIWLTRTAKANLGIFHGEVVNLPQMFLISFGSLFLFSALDGLQFFFACRLLNDNKTEDSAVTRVYVLEALGMLLGGIIFTYAFIKFFNSFQIASLLITLAIIVIYFIVVASSEINRKIILRLLVILFLLNFYLLLGAKIDLWQRLSIKKQFPQEEILDYQNSIYGNTAVTQKHNQITFYLNGIPAVVTPITDIAFAEDFTHLTLLYHPLPEDVLIISGAAGGVLSEILKEPVKKVDYAELDPLIIQEIKKFPCELTLKELSNPRVNIIYQDGRSLIKKSKKKYDVVIINLSSPTTLQINRLFTREFYQEAKNILKPGGLISVRLPGSLTYLNDELCQLNNSIYKTLSSVYKYVLVIPGEFNLFLASGSRDFQNETRETIISRFKNRNLKTSFITEFTLHYRLDTFWQNWFFERLKAAPKTNFLNEDFSCRGLFFGLAFIYSFIAPQAKIVFKIMDTVNLSMVIGAFILIVLFSLFLLKQTSKNKAVGISLNWLISTSGFCAITQELVLILAFQIIYGFIYSWIGILSSAFMLGLAFGGFAANSKFGKDNNSLKIMLKLEFVIIAFSIILPALVMLLSKISQAIPPQFIKIIFFTLSLFAGIIFGAEFSLANKYYFKDLKVAPNNARLYASDLIGASLGAILSAVWLIPVLGIWQTGILMASLKLGAIAVFIFSVRK